MKVRVRGCQSSLDSSFLGVTAGSSPFSPDPPLFSAAAEHPGGRRCTVLSAVSEGDYGPARIAWL